ncbi:MAG TPA: trypsin-like serine protease, partial [Candidatus Campbellbacteria bacterium]|nr:trypsin-like serine protease [Candidatus Campbellbacteria bacterium]
MNDLTRAQVIMLVLLVSFVTSLVTGIVTVTLVNQAPPPITQTINKVIERTIRTVVPGDSQTAATAAPIIVTQEDRIVKIVNNVSSAVVSVVATKDMPVIEKYYINPFKNNAAFKNLPGGFLPDVKIPQYRQKGVEKRQISSGTGFFVSSDGLIITNKHVVADTAAEYSIVMNDGRKFEAKILARDPFQDIAILKVKGEKFNFISLDDSKNVKVGQTVIAIGNTLGEFQNTVSRGIVSGLNRKVTALGGISGPEKLQELIQTDASINPGNSGGPLLNLNGRAIGINTAMAKAAENVGFALPVNIAKRDIADAKEFGAVKYPYLGINYLVVDKNVKKQKGLVVDYGLFLTKGTKGELAVAKGSAAEKAGLKEGDILLEINGTKLSGSDSLAYLLSKLRVGD